MQKKYGIFGWKPLQVYVPLAGDWRGNSYPSLEDAKEALEIFKARSKPPEVVYEEDV